MLNDSNIDNETCQKKRKREFDSGVNLVLREFNEESSHSLPY